MRRTRRRTTTVVTAALVLSGLLGTPGAAQADAPARSGAFSSELARVQRVAQDTQNFGNAEFRLRSGRLVIATVGEPAPRLRAAARRAERRTDLDVRFRQARFTWDHLIEQAEVAVRDERVAGAWVGRFGNFLEVAVRKPNSPLLDLDRAELRDELGLDVPAVATYAEAIPDTNAPRAAGS